MHSQNCVGLQFAFTNLIAYTSARTLSTYYDYSPLKIGFVILSFGIGKLLLSQDFFLNRLFIIDDSGAIAGSVWGGRWSDYELARLNTANGGKTHPEVVAPSGFQRTIAHLF